MGSETARSNFPRMHVLFIRAVASFYIPISSAQNMTIFADLCWHLSQFFHVFSQRCPSMRKKGILSFGVSRRKFEDIKLIEISRSQITTSGNNKTLAILRFSSPTMAILTGVRSRLLTGLNSAECWPERPIPCYTNLSIDRSEGSIPQSEPLKAGRA